MRLDKNRGRLTNFENAVSKQYEQIFQAAEECQHIEGTVMASASRVAFQHFIECPVIERGGNKGFLCSIFNRASAPLGSLAEFENREKRYPWKAVE
ncbi:MAG: hypothetical protein J7M06_05825 [Proteobacteria bacterium]|nr:hypothetical protein [Pseudomonadota bacterium]